MFGPCRFSINFVFLEKYLPESSDLFLSGQVVLHAWCVTVTQGPPGTVPLGLSPLWIPNFLHLRASSWVYSGWCLPSCGFRRKGAEDANLWKPWLVWRSFSFRILKPLFHSLLASSVSVKKSKVTLTSDSCVWPLFLWKLHSIFPFPPGVLKFHIICLAVSLFPSTMLGTVGPWSRNMCPSALGNLLMISLMITSCPLFLLSPPPFFFFLPVLCFWNLVFELVD